MVSKTALSINANVPGEWAPRGNRLSVGASNAAIRSEMVPAARGSLVQVALRQHVLLAFVFGLVPLAQLLQGPNLLVGSYDGLPADLHFGDGLLMVSQGLFQVAEQQTLEAVTGLQARKVSRIALVHGRQTSSS